MNAIHQSLTPLNQNKYNLSPYNNSHIQQQVEGNKLRNFSPVKQQKIQVRPVKVFSHYEYFLDDQIGKGYSSIVYKGKDQKTQEQVAIKVIQMNNLQQIHKQLLNQEIKALKLISSNNVLKLKDIFETQNHTYIITEYCENGDLNKIIKQYQRIPESIALELLEGIAQGCVLMWKSGIIHRDLKPANILISKNTPKVADFGFSISVSDNYNKNLILGTPQYMAPESIKQNLYTPKTDIWSLGIIFYQMLYGKVPYQGNDIEAIKILIDTTVLQFDNNIQDRSKSILLKTLVVDPNQRVDPQNLMSLIKNEYIPPVKPLIGLKKGKVSDISSTLTSSTTQGSIYMQTPLKDNSKAIRCQTPYTYNQKSLNYKILENQDEICSFLKKVGYLIDQTSIPSFLQKEKLLFCTMKLLWFTSTQLIQVRNLNLNNNIRKSLINFNDFFKTEEFITFMDGSARKNQNYVTLCDFMIEQMEKSKVFHLLMNDNKFKAIYINNASYNDLVLYLICQTQHTILLLNHELKICQNINQIELCEYLLIQLNFLFHIKSRKMDLFEFYIQSELQTYDNYHRRKIIHTEVLRSPFLNE